MKGQRMELVSDVLLSECHSQQILWFASFQATEAMVKAIEDLGQYDYFNLIIIDDDVRKWQYPLRRATYEYKRDAIRFVQSLEPSGSRLVKK